MKKAEIKQLEEWLEHHKKEIGEENLKESGETYLLEVYPEKLKNFMDQVKNTSEGLTLSRREFELVLLSANLALRNRVGIKVHTYGALKAGLTKKDILDALFLVASAANHNIVVNVLADLKTILEEEGK
jgi:alkylhydroperoxidase/carboxymuconolactone decarboxylase family protein YurZ